MTTQWLFLLRCVCAHVLLTPGEWLFSCWCIWRTGNRCGHGQRRCVQNGCGHAKAIIVAKNWYFYPYSLYDTRIVKNTHIAIKSILCTLVWQVGSIAKTVVVAPTRQGHPSSSQVVLHCSLLAPPLCCLSSHALLSQHCNTLGSTPSIAYTRPMTLLFAATVTAAAGAMLAFLLLLLFALFFAIAALFSLFMLGRGCTGRRVWCITHEQWHTGYRSGCRWQMPMHRSPVHR